MYPSVELCAWVREHWIFVLAFNFAWGFMIALLISLYRNTLSNDDSFYRRKRSQLEVDMLSHEVSLSLERVESARLENWILSKRAAAPQ